MKNLLFIFILFACLPVLSQERTREGTRPERLTGKLSAKITSLKKLAASTLPVHHPSRTMQGLLYKKPYKEPGIDHGRNREKDPVVQRGFFPKSLEEENPSIRSGTIISVNTEGAPFTSVVPADPVIAAGPGHLLQMVNGSQGAIIRVLDKTGMQIMKPVYMHQVLGAPGYFGYGDPVVLYDQFANRFIISEFGSDSCNGCYPNTMVIGISSSPDPTAGWYFYTFTTKGVLVDFPKYASWPDILFASTNDFNSAGNSYLGTSLYAFDKIAMMNGSSKVNIQRSRINNKGYNKYLSLAPVSISGNAVPANPSEGLFMYFHDNNRTIDDNDADSLGIIKFKVNFNDSNLSVIENQQQLTVAPFKSRVCNGSRNCVISAIGDGYDEISDRIMHKIYYRNFGTHESIVLNHTVDANYPTGDPKAGIRWYQLSRDTSTWKVLHQSTFSPGSDGRFMGAININAFGQVALAYNLSGEGKFASIYFTGRNAGDSNNEMSYQEQLLVEGDGYGTQGNRWGDYSDLVTDPLDDSAFWYCGMYGSGNWKTRIAAIKFAGSENNSHPVSIRSIEIPKVKNCEDKIYPAVKISNDGSGIVNSIKLIFGINGVNKDSLHWSGKLFPGEERVINLQKNYQPIQGFQHQFHIQMQATLNDSSIVEDVASKSFTVFKTIHGELAEDFETVSILQKNWLSISTGNGQAWKQTTLAASSGGSVIFLNNQKSTISNNKSNLYFPPVKFVGMDSLYLSFQLAFPGSIQGGFNDSLEVLIGEPCSENSRLLWKAWGNNIKTTLVASPPYSPVDSVGYIPGRNDWKNYTINITDSVSLTTPFQLIIRSGSNKGHNLYLDKIKVYGVILPGILKQKGYLVYPNPSKGQIIIRHWKEPNELKKVEFFNSLGQRIWSQVFNGNATKELHFNLNGYSAGIYQVKLIYEHTVITERIIIVK